MAEAPARVASQEIGNSGLKYDSGVLTEEFLYELQGAKGVEIYREMSMNDPIVGAISFVIELMVSQVTWTIDSFEDLNKDNECKEFIEQCLFEDMSSGWADMLSEICTMFTYGWGYLEQVYKIRAGDEVPVKSKYDDRLIGWRKWALRGQNTLKQWDIDESGGITGMVQFGAKAGDPGVLIPIEKSLLFRTRVERNNPEGLSLFRRAYRSWWYLKKFQEIEAIGIERDLAGLPVLRPPADLNIWNTQDPEMVNARRAAESLIRSIRRGTQEGILIPGGESEFKRWELTLLSSSSRRQFDIGATITRYETRIAMSALADFLILGSGATGSWALSKDKTEMFTIALGGFLRRIVDVVNKHAIPRLLELNPKFDKKRPPKLNHGDIETQNLTELATYLAAMFNAGASLFPDEKLEAHLRRLAKLPEPSGEAIPPDPRDPPRPGGRPVPEPMDPAEVEKRLRELSARMKESRLNGHV